MRKIPLFVPYVSWLARIYALKVLMGTQLAEGPVVKCFEREFARFIMRPPKHVVSLNSGTTALELAYELLDLQPGDEVITPVLTCTATNLPLVRRGVKIVFADIDEKTLNLSVEDVARKITPRTKAIVFVHFGGSPGGLRQLLVLAGRHNIRVVEDAAQSVGASPFNYALADFTCISLQAIKTLTAGDGGFLVCRDEADAAKARKLRWFGYDREEKQRLGDTDLELAGYKYHMNDVNAAIGLGNLRAIHHVLAKRRQVREWYRKEFELAGIPSDFFRLYPWLTIFVHPEARSIDVLLKRWGIGSGPYHYRNDQYTVMRKAVSTQPVKHGKKVWVGQVAPYDLIDGLPNMDRLENSYTLLPFHHKLTRKHVARVVHLISYQLYCFKVEDLVATMDGIWK